MLRVPTPFPDELERLIHNTIGCGIQVHRLLGPGLLERIYVRALCLELEASGLAFEMERLFPVFYRGHLLREQRVDLVVGGQLVVEAKAVDHINPVHHAQVMSYLRVSGLKVALLMNFNVAFRMD
jgi:GxxExxY protein